MPLARNGNTQLFWESTGQGPAVLLVAGQWMTTTGWWATITVLARTFRVIAFDNRDTGRSDHVAWPYTAVHMAADAVAVLDAAQEKHAHVYGISLGGMVAQEIALRHPDRVDALVLGATSAGGGRAVLPGPLPMTYFARAGTMAPEEAEWAAVPYTYGETTRRLHADRIAENIAHRMVTPTDALAFVHQTTAVAAHNAFDRLGRIAAPTLVVHGGQDAVVPAANGVLLAERIPGAQLRLWPRAGHLYIVDEPRADREVARFLRRHSGPTSARPAGGPSRTVAA
jgi:pimeloyl-ACP methyl ester carboxylesterase